MIRIGKITSGIAEYIELEDIPVKKGNGKTIIKTASEQLEEYVFNGWKIVEDIDDSKAECEEEYCSVLIEPVEKKDTIGFTYTKQFDRKLASNKIEELKSKLSDSDYKVRKCYEYFLVCKDLPYDISILHSEAQFLRDKINELEQLIVDNE